jgi:Stress responsive A/B Barrel Domain
MFRLIILMQLKEGVDPAPFIAALEEMPKTVPSIRSSVATPDLGLTKEYGHNCSFSWVAEFDDEAGWDEYIASQEHDDFYELYKDKVEQYLVSQWAFG